MKEHICREIRYCSCYALATEPSEDCLIHGVLKQPRCSYCGRFLMYDVATDILNTAAKHGYFGSVSKNGSRLLVKLIDNNIITASSSKD